MCCLFTGQRGSTGGDDHGNHHADGRPAVPQHAHADAECEERQAALEHDVHGKTEAAQGPHGEGGLQRGQDAHRAELLQRTQNVRMIGTTANADRFQLTDAISPHKVHNQTHTHTHTV